jgi:nitric oxide reductase activation protein
MWEEYERDWKAGDWRIRCIGHIINLVVQAFLFSDLVDMEELESYEEEEANRELTDEEAKKAKFRLLGPLGKAHNIVVHIRSSGGRAEQFRKLVGRMIPMDNRTRWNSWHNMLEVLLKEKAHVDKYCEDFEHELRKDLLDLADWKKLRTINDFLQPFASGTLFTEGNSIDRTLFTMDVLIKHIQITIVSPLPSLLLPS